MWSSDIVITNITLRDSPFWTLHPYDCKNITIRNVTILAPIFEAPNTDGIDPGKCVLLWRTLFTAFLFVWNSNCIFWVVQSIFIPSDELINI